uniref:Uncharacterized protein n=1 Tax=Paramoeba aestuarina TaxID=180227 RepID=A0A7S4PBP0_9EUKA|mmetsp:Transcript_39698/g.62769  ORF Transcript_39698/g.62769 Transcript_39698/m.62769 type:complete len:198 (+) Transcript_39698:200-793(+)|eukprot:CAMPEP_0201527392 /NCGR_PEP_ID=MMETSP0161_2-20130828/35059_1 /ASSEMBLY_ACC=CAM_ASM_000251 /TAXON_ID=180227 /ORGANISM="Neoparamoeba aestuarina, Strain SoJaBio B1-5/56/2" /LENGTH=197 /DNA_ID=CAMNT_0047928217 /DNA_START=252 /DNA_END=845 /DNA_ORIENTATION=+
MAAAPNPNEIKHPLQRSWTLWFDDGKRVPNVEWLDTLKQVISVATVEDFWGVFNNVISPSKLASGSNFHFFETGVKPAWEDVRNQVGGKWTVVLKKKARGGRNNEEQESPVDKNWLNLLLACIGESFPYADQLTGLVVSIRSSHGDKISLWTSKSEDEEAVLAIGKYFREQVLDCDVKVSYASHEEAQKRHSRYELP